MSYSWNANGLGKISVQNKSLECVSLGPAPDQAPTIVLLHEGLGCVDLWRDFPQRLVDVTGLGVFAYSRAGYGRSDETALPRPLNYMSEEATTVLPGVLSQIGFRRGVLLGHSDGATIASIYAGSVSDYRVRGLVLMAPHFFTEEVGLAAIAQAKTHYETGDLRDRLAKYHTHVDNAFQGWNDAWLDPEFVKWNVGDTIDHWRIPVLAIQGRDDQYGTLAQIEEIETRIYSPLETAVLDDCRHAPHLDQPEKTLTAIADFVERLERLENQSVNVA